MIEVKDLHKAFGTVKKNPVMVRIAKFWMVDVGGAAAG